MTSTKTRFHRDGTVTLWDVYQQQWRTLPAESVPDRILATLPDAERQRIGRLARLAAIRDEE